MDPTTTFLASHLPIQLIGLARKAILSADQAFRSHLIPFPGRFGAFHREGSEAEVLFSVPEGLLALSRSAPSLFRGATPDLGPWLPLRPRVSVSAGDGQQHACQPDATLEITELIAEQVLPRPRLVSRYIKC